MHKDLADFKETLSLFQTHYPAENLNSFSIKASLTSENHSFSIFPKLAHY